MRTRRPWLLISSIAMTLISATVVVLWWYLPVAAPAVVLRWCPFPDPSERAVVRLIEMACDRHEDPKWVLTEHSKHPAITAGLVRALRHRRPDVRLRTALIGDHAGGPPNVFTGVIPEEALAPLLRDAEAGIREAVIRILRTIHYVPLAPAELLHLAKDPMRDVRIELARYARARRVMAVISVLVDDADVVVREIAVEALGRTRDPLWIPALVNFFNDPEPRVRIAAAKALGDLDDERALPGLITGLRAADPAVREAMVHALGRIEDIRALPPLIACLTDAEMTVRRAAANALGVIGDPRAIPALALCSAKDVDRSVRCAAVSALDAIKDPAVIDPLMKALHDPDAVVRAMAEAAIARRP